MERKRDQNKLLNDLTCVALAQAAHITDMLEIIEPKAEELLRRAVAVCPVAED